MTAQQPNTPDVTQAITEAEAARNADDDALRAVLSGPLSTADATPPLVALAHIGDDIDPDTDTVIAPASGRVKVEVTHAGDEGRLWIGVGQAAQEGVGNYLDSGDEWSEFTAQAVHVLLVDAAGAQRITGMEWAA